MTELSYGIFDWDDNILHMPTLIKAYENGQPIWLTTEKFAQIRNTLHSLTFDETSYDLFYDYILNNFEMDVQRAIALKTFAPCYQTFIDMIKAGNIIAIITARGHSSETIKKGVKLLVYDYFEKHNCWDEWYSNLNNYRELFDLPKTEDFQLLEEEYWNTCYFKGVGKQKNEMINTIRKVEDSKTYEIQTFIENVYNKVNEKVKANGLKMSFGFSDDDIANVQKIFELFNTLNNIYPMIKFRLYDSSNRELKKIIIGNDIKYN